MALVLIFRVNNVTKQLRIFRWQLKRQPKFEATSGFPREMTSEKRLRKFHTDDFLMTIPLPRSG